MTETVMQFKSVDDIIRFSRAAEQCTSHTYIMQGKTKIRADDLLAIFCVDYTVPVVVIHEDATEFAHAMMIEKAKSKKEKEMRKSFRKHKKFRKLSLYIFFLI